MMNKKAQTCADNPDGFRLRHDAWGRLELIEESGSQHSDIEVVPNFPFTDPERWISLRDAKGSEITCIENPQQLPSEVREVLEEELSRRAFIPRITRIVHVSGITEPCEWQIETDHGPTRLLLASEDDVRRLSTQQVLIINAHAFAIWFPTCGSSMPRAAGPCSGMSRRSSN